MTDSTTPSPRRGVQRRWWLTSLVMVLVVLLAGEAAVRLASGKLGEPLVWYSRSAQNKADALERPGHPRADVVFVGSSVVMASLDPSRFTAADSCRRTSYNAATAGAVPSVTADWLYRVVIPSVRPKTVVLGIAPRDLSKSSGSADSAYFRSMAVRDDLGAKVERWFSSWSALVRYRSMLRSPRILKGRLDELRGQTKDIWTFDAHGFAPRTGTDGPNTAVQSNNPGMAIDPTQVRALDRLVVRLRRSGITPVLAAMGNSTTWRSTPRGAQVAKDEGAALADIAERRGVQLVDLRSVDDPSLFLDLVHTNREGSRKETALLVDQMASGCTG
ncbi:MAG: hypothetical protein U0Q22_02200 [Acidimicrobiales bacterium]